MKRFTYILGTLFLMYVLPVLAFVPVAETEGWDEVLLLPLFLLITSVMPFSPLVIFAWLLLITYIVLVVNENENLTKFSLGWGAFRLYLFQFAFVILYMTCAYINSQYMKPLLLG